MRFQFSLGVWQHYKATVRIHLRPTPFLLVNLSVQVVSLFLVVNLWQMGVRSPLAYLATLVVIVLYTPTLIFLRLVWRRRRARGAYNDMTVIIDDAGVTQQTILGTTRVAWNGLLNVQGSAGLFLFYVTTQLAIAVPVRVVQREGLLSQLRTIILTKFAANRGLAAG